MVQSSMAPMRRRARKVNERHGNGGAEESSGKEAPNAAANKSKSKKRKLPDPVGAQWGEEELERFYASYRKYGKDWRKVSGTLCNRTPDMVEALYNMNRAYLSLPEGAATVAGLIAMMTDHYGNSKGNDSENESEELSKKASGKQTPKHGKCKQKTEFKAPESDYTHPHSPSVLNKKSSGDMKPRAVRKRTPRVLIGSIRNRNNRKLNAPIATERREDDDGPHTAAKTLAVVSCDVATIKNCESEKNVLKAVKSVGNGEGIIGSREDANKINLKGIIGNKSDDDHGDCNNVEVYSDGSRKVLNDDGNAALPAHYDKSQQLFYGDDESVFAALHTLADVSVNILQSTNSKSESLAEVRDDNDESKSNSNSNEKQSKSKNLWKKDKRKIGGGNSDGGNCKKIKTFKGITSMEVCNNTPKSEKGNKHNPMTTKMPIEEENVSSRKSKHTFLAAPLAEKSAEKLDKGNSNDTQIKITNRRKCGIVKAFSKRLNEATVDKRSFSHAFNADNHLKEKLSHALSNSSLRRWCGFEWFYGAIDYPWFVQNEFVEYLNFLQLGHMSRLTRGEWGFIRSSLPKPRRFSSQFLKVERNKLNLYRALVRNYFSALKTGELVGHQADFAHYLTAGQRVIARHRKSGELHNGSVLNVDLDSCKVQFDRPELGIEFVLDIDCMPLNLVRRNVSEALRSIITYANKNGDIECVIPENVWRIGDFCNIISLENGSGSSSRTVFSHLISALMKETKQQHSVYSVAQEKAMINEAANVGRQDIYKEPCTLSQIEEREADLIAIADFFRALNKKEALVMELRNMNEEILRRGENDGLSDSDIFKNQYAIVIAQLQEADVQVESAKFTLRERNTYNKNIPKQSQFTESNGEPPDFLNSTGFDNSHSSLAKLMKNSRKRAQMMVDAAIQAMCSTNEGEQPDVKIEQALDKLTNNNYNFDSLHVSSIRENLSSAQLDSSSKTDAASDGEITFPSELITSCVSTLLMIQGCVQEIHPPAEMAHMLDLALASMKPRCPENAGLYRDIESAISKIKNMMLSIVPSPNQANSPLVN